MKKYEEDYVRVGDIETDARVERPLDQNKVKRIYDDFDEAALGVATLSRRTNHGLVVIDGQHRIEVLRRKFGDEGFMPCHIYTGLTLAQEAELFLKLNNTTKPRVIDKFPIRVTAEDPAAVAIDKMVREYGWKVSNIPGNASINAVAALGRVYERSVKVEAEPNLVQAVILTITRAWGHDRFGAQGAILEGLGRLLEVHGSKVELDRLIDKLKEWPGGPAELHSRASALAKISKIRVTMAVAQLLTEEYNKGRRKDQLPAWRHRT